MNDENGCAVEQNVAFTHQCLSILLQDLIDRQASPPLLTLKLFDGRLYNVRLLLEVAFVIGDQLSQDTTPHCCRKKKSMLGEPVVYTDHASPLFWTLQISNQMDAPSSQKKCLIISVKVYGYGKMIRSGQNSSVKPTFRYPTTAGDNPKTCSRRSLSRDLKFPVKFKKGFSPFIQSAMRGPESHLVRTKMVYTPEPPY
jgi:hypothetical protein